MANSSSVSMAELPSFMAPPHCDLTPSKHGSFPCHGYLFKAKHILNFPCRVLEKDILFQLSLGKLLCPDSSRQPSDPATPAFPCHFENHRKKKKSAVFPSKANIISSILSHFLSKQISNLEEQIALWHPWPPHSLQQRMQPWTGQRAPGCFPCPIVPVCCPSSARVHPHHGTPSWGSTPASR